MITLIVADCDYTDRADGLEWTTVDPGGFETASFQLPNDAACPVPGAPVTICEGLRRVFMGRVEEPGDDYDEQRAPSQVSAVGAGVAAKDNRIQGIFMDRSLSTWGGPSRQRMVNLLSSNLNSAGGGTQLPDATTGSPALDVGFDDPGGWLAANKPIVEAWYDAGSGNLIGRLRGSWALAGATGAADANWTNQAALVTDDVVSSFDGTGDIHTGSQGSSGTAEVIATTARRFALLQWFYSIAGGSAGSNARFGLVWTNLRIIGNQGLTIRGATPATEGFYPSDIAAYVLGQVAGLTRGIVETSSNFILPHAVYRTPVEHEKIAMDMATLLGWHYGVWEPLSMFSDTPRWDFRSRPTVATATVARRDCRNLKLTQRLSDFHNLAKVSFTDPAGTTAIVTVSLANPRIPRGLTRTLENDIGQSSAAVAAQVGLDELALEQQQSRAAGSVDLPPYVQTANGPKASHLLRAGLDRLKITGLPNAGAWLNGDSARFDTFRISRLTCRLEKGGGITTTADLDSGANLIETLQARLALAAGLAG